MKKPLMRQGGLLNMNSHIFQIYHSVTKATLLPLLLLILALTTSCEKKYCGPPYEIKYYEMTENYAKKYFKHDDIELIHIGDFTYPEDRIMFGLWFRSYSSESIDEGRIRAVAFLNDWLEMMQHNEVAKTYFEESKRHYRPVPASLDHHIMGVKIAYWDKSVNRPKAPYLAEIIFSKDKFRYYEADPDTQALRLVLEESYDDAMSRVNDKK